MKKIIINISIFIICLISIILIVILVFPYNKNSYLRAYRDKVNLLESTESPRMILVGGSNVGFGFDSNLIQDSLKLNVINTGLYADLGLKFMLDDIQNYAKKGDVIILAFEYAFFYNELNMTSTSLLDIILAVDHSKINLLNLEDKIKIINYIPKYIKSVMINALVTIINPNYVTSYSLDAFNEKGDAIKHWGQPNRTFKNELIGKNKTNEETINYFISRINDLKNKGCCVYLLPCALNNTSYQMSKSNIDILEKQLMDKNIGYISTPLKSAFPDSLFYNTAMHLNHQGAILRSIQLVSDYKKTISQDIEKKY